MSRGCRSHENKIYVTIVLNIFCAKFEKLRSIQLLTHDDERTLNAIDHQSDLKKGNLSKERRIHRLFAFNAHCIASPYLPSQRLPVQPSVHIHVQDRLDLPEHTGLPPFLQNFLFLHACIGIGTKIKITLIQITV